MFLLNKILILILTIIISYISYLLTINLINYLFINLPISINFLDIINYLFSLTLIIVFFILILQTQIYFIIYIMDINNCNKIYVYFENNFKQSYSNIIKYRKFYPKSYIKELLILKFNFILVLTYI